MVPSEPTERSPLIELLLIIATVLGGLVLLNVLATSVGTDSRDSIGDDWGRPIRL